MSRRGKISDMQVLLAYVKYRQNPYKSRVDEILIQETGLSEKEVYYAMSRACKKDLIDYGVSLRCGWLTEKGKEFLKQNETKSTKEG